MQEEKLKHFWRRDGHDFIADIGIMSKAIVVTYCVPSLLDSANGWYKISNRSYFPFPDEYYKKEFKDPFEVIALAETYIRDWVRSLLIASDTINSPDQDVLAMQVYLKLGY